MSQIAPYECSAPAAGAAPLVLDSPHSGNEYPSNFRASADACELQRLEDAYVHELFSGAPQLGATLLYARFPRALIDPNRALDDMDPAALSGPWPHRLKPSRKALLGVGLAFTRTPNGRAIYDEPIDVVELQHRIDRYYQPYHSALTRAIERFHALFGFVWHLNCHSMPSRGLTGLPEGERRADFCLGDRHGTTCNRDLTDLVANYLGQLGYRVSVNDPYAGVEIVRRYGQPARGVHSLQLEINRDLYMDESTAGVHAGFDVLRQHLAGLVKHLSDAARLRIDVAAE